MGKPKFIQVFAGVSILWMGILLMVLTLSLTLLPEQGQSGGTGSFNNRLPASTSTCIFVALFLIVYIECALWWTRQSLRIEEAKLEYKDKSLWTQIAVFFQYAGIVQAVILSLVLLALAILFAYIIINLLTTNPLSISSGFFVMAGIYAAYVIARNLLLTMFKKSRAARKLGTDLPTYVLTNKDLTIDLKMKNLKDQSKNLVKIGFDELDEIRTFSFVEAQTFLKYEIGPNLEIVIKQTRDLHDYVKGRIERPSVYTFTAIQSVGEIVLLKGPDLFYFLSFDSEDVSDLVTAFNSFKSSGKIPLKEMSVQSPVKETATKPAQARRSNFCTQCGNRLAADVNFCNKCGTKVK